MEIEYELTEAMFRKAIFRQLLKIQIILCLILFIIPPAFICFIWFSNMPADAFPFIIVPMIALVPAVVFSIRRQVIKIYKAMPDHTIRVRFGDEEVHFGTEQGGSGTHKWRGIHKLLCFNDVWLLYFSHCILCILPVEKLTPEIRELILRKMREHHIKVSGKTGEIA